MKSNKRSSKKKIYILREYCRAEGSIADTGHFLNLRVAKKHVTKLTGEKSFPRRWEKGGICAWETDDGVFELREVTVTA